MNHQVHHRFRTKGDGFQEWRNCCNEGRSRAMGYKGLIFMFQLEQLLCIVIVMYLHCQDSTQKP
jgi:hypothetical protein